MPSSDTSSFFQLRLPKLGRSLLAFALALSCWAIALPTLAAGEVDLHIESAKNYTKVQQWGYANNEWREALKLEPKNLEATLGLAYSLTQSSFPAEAIAHLDAARGNFKDPKQLQAIDLALADAYTAAQQYLSAEKIYLSILKADHFHPEAFKGLNQLTPKLPKSHQIKLKRVMEAQAQEAKKHAQLAIKQGNLEEAVRNYQVATTLLTKSKVMNDTGLALMLSGRTQGAEKVFSMLTSQLENWQVFANAGVVSLSRGKTYQARRQMERAIQLCDNNRDKARLYNNLGYIYESSNQPTKARFAYERAVELDPKLTKAWLNLGYTHQRQMNYDKAVDVYKSILAKEPANADAWVQLGFTYERMYKYKQAERAYKTALARNPKHKEAYFNLGSLYKKMDKMDAADLAYKQMSELEFAEMEAQGKKATQAALSAPPVPSANPLQAQNTPSDLQNKPEGKVLQFMDVFFQGFTL